MALDDTINIHMRSMYKSILMLIIIALLLHLYVISTTSSTAVPLPQLNLEAHVERLRGDDHRLVRYNVPDDDSKSRQNEICTKNFLEAVMDALHDMTRSIHSMISVYPYKQVGLCLQLLTLCATNNNGPRNHIGYYKNGDTMVKIVKLIQHPISNFQTNNSNPNYGQEEGMIVFDAAIRTSAYASESVWILSFNSENHDLFVDADAVKALRKVIVSNRKSPSMNVAKMWALAAIQNLAASYCESPTGHCRWYYDEDTNKVKLHSKTPLTIDGINARTQIVHDSELIHAITHLACRQPSSSSGPHSNDNPWPTRATSLHELHDNMPTWAATGAIKNLILSQEIWPDIFLSKHCLCDLKYSADWLEAEKAKDALSRLGLSQTCISPWYKHCQDVSILDKESEKHDWMNSFKETCIMYGENDWCHTYGHLTNENGLAANEACCACGGGVISAKSDEL